MNKHRFLYLLIILILLASGLAISPAAGRGSPAMGSTFYVDVEAAGANNGTSWEDAFTDLQLAMGAAIAGDQVWVAAGTYYPSVEHCGTGGRYISFQLKNGVAVYGGFDPTVGDIGWDDRDWVANVTVLSGNIGWPDNNIDNSYHVFCHPEGLNLDSTAILDGFTIRDGNSDGSVPDDSGAGMFNVLSSPTLTNITFTENIAGYGSGMYNSSSAPALINITFVNNSANSNGGGIFNTSSAPSLTNVIFIKNSALIAGGGIYNHGSSPVLTNVSFTRNSSNVGGGISNEGSSPILTNSILWGNIPDELSNDEFSNPIVTYSDIQGGYSGTGNIEVNPWFADALGGNLRLQTISPAIDAGDNSADGLVGITSDLDGNPRFIDVPIVVDSGNGTPPIVDMGAYEVQPHTYQYVDVDATGNNDGSSWENAYTDLQPAFEASESGGQILVAAGTYYPSVEFCGTGDERFKSFQLKNDVAVYGGFDPSVGDVNAGDRDWLGNATILSGDIGIQGDNSDNSYHVVCNPWELYLNTSAILNGFNITGGNANIEGNNGGGGMVNGWASPTLTNIIFTGNTAQTGGGVYNDSSSPTLTNVSFTNNSAINGGGMGNSESCPTLDWVSFTNNSAEYGGGMYNSLYYGCAFLTEVSFTNNSAVFGGGMYNYDHYYGNQPIILTDVTFTNNSATSGGGIYNAQGAPTLTNVLFSGNVAENGGGMYNGYTYHGSAPTLTNVTFTDNSATNGGGGMYNNSSAPMLTNVSLHDNLASNGAALYNEASSATLLNVIVSSNSASSNGGGIYNGNSSTTTMTNVTFFMNSAGYAGGGIYNTGSSAFVTNSILWGNLPTQIEGDSATVSYSDIQGGYTGEHNIDKDPIFIDAASGNLHPGSFSPTIDSGNNNAPGLVGIVTDLDGNPRFFDIPWVVDTGSGMPPIVDMGAYEVQPTIYYVDWDAAGNNDGSSWKDAFTTLQPALEAAKEGDQIWTAEGIYLPTVENCGTGDRYKSFQLKNWVAIYGGFDPSIGDINWDERDSVKNQTILSGDIGTPGDSNDNTYHVFCHPSALNLDHSAILDGFTIQDGWANGQPPEAFGGGMYNYASSPSLYNIIFINNNAELDGGGMYNESSSPSLANVIFKNNGSSWGGAMYNRDASRSALINVTFNNNSAVYDGGGIFNYYSSPTLDNCILWGDTPNEIGNNNSDPAINYSDIQGGYAGNGNISSDPIFIDAANGNLHLQDTSPAIDAGDNSAVPSTVTTDLDGNSRFADVPWIVDSGVGTPPIVDMGAYEYHRIIYVDIDANGNQDGTSWGDAYTNPQPALEIATVGDEIWVAAGTYFPTVPHCGDGDRDKSFQLKNGVSVYGGFDPSIGDTSWQSRDWMRNGTTLSGDPNPWLIEDNSYHVFCHPSGLNLDSSAVLDGFTITGGNGRDSAWPYIPYRNGAGMYNDFSSPSLVNVVISGNVGANGGGMHNYYSSPLLTNVTFAGNSANGDWVSGSLGCGGGMFNSFSSPTLTNVTFYGNSSNGDGIIMFGCGAGMANYDSSPTLTNVTIFGNATGGSGGALFNSNSSPTLVNTILWGNQPDQIAGDPATVSYSDIQGGYDGVGNIDTDPQFFDVSDWNLHLRYDSPAIDAGNNLAVPPDVLTDLDGNSRFEDVPWIVDTGSGTAPIVDMGAYEAQFKYLVFMAVVMR